MDQYWGAPGTITAETRAAAKLTIEHELRNEFLEEWTPEEVNEVAASIRDRIYTSFLHKQEENARRAQTVEERKAARRLMRFAKRQNAARKRQRSLTRGFAV